MSKRVTITVLSVIAFIILLYFSNPGEEEHLHFLQKGSSMTISWDQGTDSFTGEDGSQYNYNDYYIFSTTTSVKDNKRRSMGLLWMVF